MTTHIDTARPQAIRELQKLKQWVVWCYEERDGKRTKVPYNVRTGGMASTTKPATWASYDHAVTALQRGRTWDNRAYDGLGFVLANGYVGVDFDHCRNPETGELDELAARRITALASYSEISPGKAGVHTLARGNLPAAVKRPDIEMYSRARFFTITGKHLTGTPGVIEHRQDELTALYEEVAPKKPEKKKRAAQKQSPYELISFDDTALLEVASKARNGAKFDALWRGDTGGYGGDESRADQALCNMLAFWTGNDPTRIDQLFRQSGLYRDKWDREDYRDSTIEHAIDITTETYRRKVALDEGIIPEEKPPDPPPDLLEAHKLIDELYQENAKLREELRVIRRTDMIPAKIATVSRKETFKAVYQDVTSREPDTEDGWYRVEPWRYGIMKGQSAQTTRDNLEYYVEKIPAMEKKLKKVVDVTKKEGYRYETYIKPTDQFLPERHRIRKDEEIHHGGSQICDTCHEEIKEVTHVLTTQRTRTCGCGTRSFAVVEKNRPFEVGFFDFEGRRLQSQVDNANENEESANVQSQLDQCIDHTPLTSQVDNASSGQSFDVQSQVDNARSEVSKKSFLTREERIRRYAM